MSTPWQPPGPSVPPSSEPRPVPRYGEYAPEGYVSPVPPQPVAQPVDAEPVSSTQPPVERRARTADVVATCILLFLGLLGTVLAILETLALPQSLPVAYAQYGVDYHASNKIEPFGVVIVVSHIVLFVIALAFSILLMVRRRASFWLPLVCGVVAALVFWGVLIALVLGDGRLIDAINSRT